VYVLIRDIQQGAGMWKSYESEEELDSPDIQFDGPVSVALKLTNAETRILVQGKVSGSVLVECARCDEEYSLPLEFEVEEGFVSEESPEADVEGIDAFEILTYKEERLVLDEMLRQNFLAAVPMQPVCRGGECKGMCDQCGANLNTESCNCDEDEIDPRWAALKEIKNRSSDPSLN
jgi:uncharacterized protein